MQEQCIRSPIPILILPSPQAEMTLDGQFILVPLLLTVGVTLKSDLGLKTARCQLLLGLIPQHRDLEVLSNCHDTRQERIGIALRDIWCLASPYVDSVAGEINPSFACGEQGEKGLQVWSRGNDDTCYEV